MNEEPRYGYKMHAFELYSTGIKLGPRYGYKMHAVTDTKGSQFCREKSRINGLYLCATV